MTIHIKKRHYQIPRNGIQLVYVRKSGMWTVFVNNENCLRYMKRYKRESVYGWYTKVIWITGFQNLRYIFRYTISLVSERYTNKKKTYKIVYRPFFVAVLSSIPHLPPKMPKQKITKMYSLISFCLIIVMGAYKLQYKILCGKNVSRT